MIHCGKYIIHMNNISKFFGYETNRDFKLFDDNDYIPVIICD